MSVKRLTPLNLHSDHLDRRAPQGHEIPGYLPKLKADGPEMIGPVLQCQLWQRRCYIICQMYPNVMCKPSQWAPSQPNQARDKLKRLYYPVLAILRDLTVAFFGLKHR
jgi:hypothetical protein